MLNLSTLVVAFALSLTPTQERETVVSGKLGGQVDAYLQNCEAFGFSGSVLVQKKGKVLLRKGYGVARQDLGTRNTPETLYDIASASKQVTAAAILLLEAQDKLSTDDSIAEHLPEVPVEHEEITIYHLLTHTSGFPRMGSSGSGAELKPAMRTYFSANRKSKAGKKFEYYNGGYAMLAAIVERVTGDTFEDWCNENLFVKAGMKNTDFIETNRVDQELVARSNSNGKLSTDYIKGWGYKGMGGVLTSISDLNLWCNALFGGELLPPEAMEKLLTVYRDKYACGWYVFKTDKGTKVIQHGGTSPGFQSYIRYFPKQDVQILVMCNTDGWHWQTAWGVSSILVGEDAKAEMPPATSSLSSSKLEAYCGTWERKGERLVIDKSGSALRVGALGAQLQSYIAPAPFGRAKARPAKMSKPDPKAVSAAEARALDIITELREGKCDLLGEKMMSHIPAAWPGMILDKYWPEFVEQWGEIKNHRVLESYEDSATGHIRVWIRVEMEKAARSVHIAFLREELNIFDLKAKDFPAEAFVAPNQKGSLVGFDFKSDPPIELQLKGKGKSRTLVMETRSGPRLEFTLVE